MIGTLRVGLAVVALLWLSESVRAGSLVISEIMAENGSHPGLGGHHADWLELHNAGESPVELEDHHLTDDLDDPTRWKLPRLNLAPGAFLTLYAQPDGITPAQVADLETGRILSSEFRQGRSRENPHDTSLAAWMPFQLSAKGETMALIAPDGKTVLHTLRFPRQRVDVWYGLPDAGDPENAAFLRCPTPGAPNAGALQGFVSPVHISQDHGLFAGPLTVQMESSTEDAIIRYTLDGSEPQPFTGLEYTGPLAIESTTILRARAFCEGHLPSPVATRTYLFPGDVVHQSPQGEPPAGWPHGRANRQVLDYGMDPDIVLKEHTPAEVEAALLSLPSLSVVTSIENLFGREQGIYANPQNKGRAWERPASLELLDPAGGRTFQIDGGLRIRGAWSRQPENPKHALRFVFRKAYGSGKLKFPLFGEEGAAEFDHIDLRTSLNYSWALGGSHRNTLLRDIFCRDTQRDMGQPHTRSRYHHLYLNGHYWGVYMTQERSVASYAASYLGGEPRDYDVVKSRGELVDGTWDAHRAFHALAVRGFRDSENYLRAQGLNPDGTPNPAYPKYLDVDNVIDYMLITYHSGNRDGPGGQFTQFPNNFYACFNRTNPDGWKFFAHDMEHTFDVGDPRVAVRGRSLPWRYFNVHWLHEQLLQNPAYLRRFQQRVNRHLFGEGALTTASALARLDTRAAQIDAAMIAHAARWGDVGRGRQSRPFTREHWRSAVRTLRDFIEGRQEALLNEFIRMGWYEGIKPPILVDVGEQVYLTTEEGTIHYTLDGSDPMEGGEFSPVSGIAEPPVVDRRVLVGEDTQMRAWPAVHGRFDPTWRLPEFDDRGWEQGFPGLGYDDDGDYFESRLIRFDVTDSMRGKTNSVYMRLPFEIDAEVSPGSDSRFLFAFAELEMKCDDGFAAYLNGVPAAASGAPAELSWQSQSRAKPGDGVATTYRVFRVSEPALAAFREGKNVLAIHGLNAGLDSSDLIMIPRLSVTTLSGGTALPRDRGLRARVHHQGEWSPLLAWPSS